MYLRHQVLMLDTSYWQHMSFLCSYCQWSKRNGFIYTVIIYYFVSSDRPSCNIIISYLRFKEFHWGIRVRHLVYLTHHLCSIWTFYVAIGYTEWLYITLSLVNRWYFWYIHVPTPSQPHHDWCSGHRRSFITSTTVLVVHRGVMMHWYPRDGPSRYPWCVAREAASSISW